MRELSFTFVGVKDIVDAGTMLALGAHSIKVISDHYVVVGWVEQPRKNDCPIFEIMYDDIISSKNKVVHDTYQKWLGIYGQEVCDLIFPKDEEFIKDKIRRSIIFTMDKVYKSETITITFSDHDIDDPENYSSMPQIIYGAIQEHFDIIKQIHSKSKYQISIRKRKVT